MLPPYPIPSRGDVGWAMVTVYQGYALNKIDGKGRVSVPAAFRDTALARYEGSRSLVLGVNSDSGCLDCFDLSHNERLLASLNSRFGDQQSAERDKEAAKMFGLTHIVTPDDTGRIVIPELFMKVANLKSTAVFIGLAYKFQILEPSRAISVHGAQMPGLVMFIEGTMGSGGA
jgi:MraZ protein